MWHELFQIKKLEESNRIIVSNFKLHKLHKLMKIFFNSNLHKNNTSLKRQTLKLKIFFSLALSSFKQF